MNAPQWIFNALRFIEKKAAYGQGKGYGSGTVKHEVALVASLLEQKPVLAVDMGGHSGTYTRELKRLFPHLPIHIFEPSTANIAKLKARHGNDKTIVINPCAISDTNGFTSFYSDKPGSGLGSLHKRKLDHYGMPFDVEEQVRTVRFDEYWIQVLDRCTIDILKMDIEGHELCALSAFGDALSATKVLQFEFGGTNIDSRTYFQDFFYLFSEAGFDLHRITPIGLEKITRYREADEFFFTINYLATNQRFLRSA
ncbi:FkbM family methyltransferase [Variovorax terrae]|uniref:FkbM family methyltransferase n=1 Tax=Variovorax terrae TaxID=2923278 RepID=A0A9X1VVF7_9BURK|nr:FkbM family methyltransferase [Variovorax terrae]MCJ0764501.1 FkbM family methyltransferase [Variovorax terrae]